MTTAIPMTRTSGRFSASGNGPENVVVKVEKKILHYPAARSFTVIGDPGCDGLGAENMDVFVAALGAAGGDLVILAGDVVPVGTDDFYRRVAEVIPYATNKPVIALKGNHDVGAYAGHFGHSDFAIVADGFSIILLDNAKGGFTDDGLEFLYQSLKSLPGQSIIVMFHWPPPNHITGNCVSGEEWRRFVDAAGDEFNRISLFVSGHVHSYFEDQVNGVPLVATGGGGAKIELVDRVGPIQNHVVEFMLDTAGRVRYFRRDVIPGGGAGRDIAVRKILFQAYAEECAAHVRYLMLAEDAMQQGFPNLARLYRAAADSELRHARNIHCSTTQAADYLTALRNSADSEQLEAEQSYRQRLDMTAGSPDILARRIFIDTMEAEKIHFGLFSKALESVSEGMDIEPAQYHTCASCGMTFVGPEPPKNCPVCGAPGAQIRETP